MGFVSLGCAKNLVDSQVMADALLRAGCTLASCDTADVVIVNTCAFIEPARAESVSEIRSLCSAKRRGRPRAVVVAGCFAQRYRRELPARFPEVDAFLGLDDLDAVGTVVRRIAAGEQGIVQVSGPSRRLFEPASPGVLFSGGAYAYLKIAEGCNHPCAFCAIPAIRGRYRSRSVDAIVAEAEQRLEMGVRELNLISQDVTAYGRDLSDGSGLEDLLRALAGIGESFWIRILYAYPTGVTERLLETMGALPQVCRYLDVPVQHSHPEMLRAMRRGETQPFVDTLAQRVQNALPGAALRTTCLVGFPGETRRHVRHLLRYIRNSRFRHLGVFAFSPEEGTAACGMDGRPQRRTAERRVGEVTDVQREIVDDLARAKIGTQTVVLMDRCLDERAAVWSARSRDEAPEVDGHVLVANVPRRVRVGDFVRVRYTAASGCDMQAVAVPAPAHAGLPQGGA